MFDKEPVTGHYRHRSILKHHAHPFVDGQWDVNKNVFKALDGGPGGEDPPPGLFLFKR